MTDEIKNYALIYQRKGLVLAWTPTTREGYDRDLSAIKSSEDNELIFAGQGLSDDQYAVLLEQLENINYRPFSKVSKQVEDLVAILKGDGE